MFLLDILFFFTDITRQSLISLLITAGLMIAVIVYVPNLDLAANLLIALFCAGSAVVLFWEIWAHKKGTRRVRRRKRESDL